MKPLYFAMVGALVTALGPAPVSANGRFPTTVNVRFHPAEPDRILLAATFGLLLSADDGGRFLWVCEEAIGYGGTYDPDYAIAPDGDIYATTFEGLRVSRDQGCSWNGVLGPLGEQWVGEVEIGPDGRVWAATSSGGMPNDVYVSPAGGRAFASTGLLHDTAWWKTLKVAASDADRVYVTGYQVAGATAADASPAPPQALLRRSTDGGQSWQELATDDFTFGSQPQLFLLGVSPTDPDIVFARVLGTNGPTGDSLYRSLDAGGSWSKVLDMTDSIRAFTIRADGTTVYAGTVDGGVRLSTDGGDSWSTPASEPMMACIGERSDGTLFACASNWIPDEFALGRSADAESWTPVLRFSQITGPLACAPGTIQYDTCTLQRWASVAEQFGITGEADAGPPDAGPAVPAKPGCSGCRTGDRTGSLGIWLVFAVVAGRRRAKRGVRRAHS